MLSRLRASSFVWAIMKGCSGRTACVQPGDWRSGGRRYNSAYATWTGTTDQRWTGWTPTHAGEPPMPMNQARELAAIAPDGRYPGRLTALPPGRARTRCAARSAAPARRSHPEASKGSYFRGFLEPRRMAEKAPPPSSSRRLTSRASRRAPSNLVKAMGMSGISRANVSACVEDEARSAPSKAIGPISGSMRPCESPPVGACVSVAVSSPWA